MRLFAAKCFGKHQARVDPHFNFDMSTFQSPTFTLNRRQMLWLGAVLTQTIVCIEGVIAFASQTLNEVERNYTVTEKNCLAVINAVKKFGCCLEGYHVTVITVIMHI